MEITFDPVKDATNIERRSLSLALAGDIEWGFAYEWQDQRKVKRGEIFAALNVRYLGLELVSRRVMKLRVGKWVSEESLKIALIP